VGFTFAAIQCRSLVIVLAILMIFDIPLVLLTVDRFLSVEKTSVFKLDSKWLLSDAAS